MNTPNLEVSLLIDFDRAGLDTILSRDGYQSRLLSADWDIGTTNLEQRVGMDGKATFVLDNTDRYFTRTNESSPIFDKAIINAPIALDIQRPQNTGSIVLNGPLAETKVRLWTGYITELQFESQENKPDQVTLVCSQTFEELDRKGVTLPIMEDATVTEILDALIDANKVMPPNQRGFLLDAGYLDEDYLRLPSTYIQATTMNTVYTLFGYDLSNVSSLRDTLEQLAMVEQGLAFFNRRGELCFFGQDNYSVQGLYQGAINAGEAVDSEYTYGDTIFNSVAIEYTPKALVTGTILTTEVKIDANESEEVSLTPQIDGTTKTIIIKNVTSVTIDNNDVTLYVRGNDSKSVNVILINGTGSEQTVNVTVTGSYYKAEEKVTVEMSDKNAIAHLMRVRPYRKEVGLLSSNAEARRVAEYVLARYKEPLGVVTSLTYKQNKWERLFQLQTGSIVEITHDRFDMVNEMHTIVGEQGKWTPNDIEITYTLDLTNRLGFFRLNISHLDEDTLS